MDGVLVVDKPAGPTSHDVVDRARRALRERRIGHTGTLDPFATGVLPLCVGRATRLARFLSGGEKVYRASVRLGFATTTDDRTGEPLSPPRPSDVAGEALGEALAAFVGTFDQVPPAFSARHVGGRRLYELARNGEAAPRTATPVTVQALDLVSREGDCLELEVRCSAGTYVRAIARDLGERLGTGGHLVALRRTRSGAFDLSRAVPGDRLDASASAAIVPVRELLPELPSVRVGARGRSFVAHGRDLGPADVDGPFPGPEHDVVRVIDDSGELVALASPRRFEPGASGLPRLEALHPDVVVVDGTGGGRPAQG
ncbi:MAG: tRNA pseudouridine(55) synthase TruB [Vicinamibacteria bacterium]